MPTRPRGVRAGWLGVGGGLERANIDDLFAACVGDALVNKGYDPQEDKSNPNERYRIAHKSLLSEAEMALDSSSLNEIDHENYQRDD